MSRLIAWFRERSRLCKFDGVANIARVMRCPGTTNPRTGKVARVLRREPESWASFALWMLVLPPSEVSSAPSVSPKVSIDPGKVKALTHVDELGGKVRDSVKVYIVNGCNPDEPNHFPSRSEMLYWVVLELVRAEVDPAIIYSILTDAKFKVSESVLEKGRGAERYAMRQIDAPPRRWRARGRVPRARREETPDPA